MIDNDRATGSERLGGVPCVGRDHGRVSRPQTLRLPVDHQQNFALDNVPDFFLRVFVLVQIGGALGDLPVPKGHVLRVEEPTGPTGERGATKHVIGAYEWHPAKTTCYEPGGAFLNQ
jgi:hypothetical protein